MSELGQVLREAREAKGVSLAEAEDATRIRQKYLRALEEGQYDGLPPSVYVRGFLRSYAAYLGLDPEHIVDLYDQTVPEQAVPPEPRIIAEPLVPTSPVNWEVVAGILLLIAVAVLGVWVYRQYIVPLAAPPTPTPPAVEAAVAAKSDTQPNPPAITPTGAQATATFTPEPPSSTPVPATFTPRTHPTDTPARVAAATRAPGLTLVLRTTGLTWLRVVVDGKTVLERTVNAGQSRTWRARREIRVRTGNAGGVEITVNGQSLGVLGKPGQVMERIWTLTAEGKVRVSTPTPPTP